MRVLIISGAFPPVKAGEADHVFHLCHHLVKRGLDVHVLTTTGQSADSHLPFKVHRRIRNWSWPDLPRVARSMRELAPDAVLLIYTDWVYKNHLMITFAPILAKMLLPNVPFVTQLETEETSLKASLPIRALLKILRHIDGNQRPHHMATLLYGSKRIITLSERHKSRLLQKFPSLNSRSLVIPPSPLLRMCAGSNPNDRCRRRRDLGIQPTEFLAVYFGYIYAAKGVNTLFEAMRILKDRGRRLRLLIVGGGVDLSHPSLHVQSLLELADKLAIDDMISWTGEYATDSDEASRYLYAADACVLPFTSGVTLNRSSFVATAAHGLPIITTRGETLESAFLHRGNVLLCPPKNPHALALAIESLMTDPTLVQQLKLGALRLASEYFSWDKAVERTIEALSSNHDGLGRPAAVDF